MSGALPGVDFGRIRPYGQPASRSNAFEELASILIEQGIVEWPEGVRFHRFGNPDDGREGRGVLLNGDVWAWQAKYLFEFDSSAAGQVTSSVRRVLDLEPNRWRSDRPSRSSSHTTRVSPGAQLVQQLLEGGPVGAGAAGGLGEHAVAAGVLEGVDLEVWLLVGGRDAGVAEQVSHAWDGCRTV